MNSPLRDKDAMNIAALGTDIKICHCCKKTSEEKLPTCSRCKIVGYCNRECQRKDWPKHKLECKLYKDTKKDVKKSEKEIKNLTGKKKKETRAELKSNFDQVLDLDGFGEALVRVGHMICLGRTLIDTGITLPTHCLFEVNTSAREIFSKSKFESLRSTFVVTAYPFEHLEQVLLPAVANQVRTQFANQEPLDKDSGGCIWFARPDHWRGEYNTNSINQLPFESTKLLQVLGVDCPKELRAVKYMREILMSQRLSLNGASQIPVPLMHLTNNRNWNALAKSSDFHKIVQNVPFGVMMRRTSNDIPDSKTAMVTLFVNTKAMKRFVQDTNQEMDIQFQEVIEERGENPLEFAHARLIEHYKEFDVKFAFAQRMLEASRRMKMNK
ncbi:hypothetical protein CTEN210_12959 [Chaetoceros tenuissimus]|uniref:MYND-type domain-containing protein n=1 Tax=Chaetoceros tenuissimus TaxID=426638 RepID=A0AAD3D2C1_9STRA|nr:hypothetical protein CTEN210_12959 [Chaetoceros tenuissimus]